MKCGVELDTGFFGAGGEAYSRRLGGICEQDVKSSACEELRLDGESEVKPAAWEGALRGLWPNLLLRHKKETWPENWWVCKSADNEMRKRNYFTERMG